ncbi:MAG: hypothetical protein K8T25_20630 [Planctomycetia bacterium]|nr:hypothetical protein [Planctomycetia bacterium]
MRQLLSLHGDWLVRAAGVSDVQPALLVKVAGDRPIDQRRAGDEFDLVARRDEDLSWKGGRVWRGGIGGVKRGGGEENDKCEKEV